VLSITVQPAAAARGAYSAEISLPAENRPMSAREKSNSARSSHRQLLAGEAHALAERAIARQRVQLGHGKFALLEHADHGVAHQSGRPDHRHPEAACHRSS
jgi:hypothetical protein